MNERQARPSALDRVLRVVGDVRAGEGPMALVLGLTVFVLLGSYYLLKVAREAMLLSQMEAEWKVYIYALQAMLLVPVVQLFGKLSTRIGRVRLITFSTLFFTSHLVIFAALHALHEPAIARALGVAFFVWVGIFNVFVIAQFWTFANDLYTEDQGRRLFAVIGLGSALGAIVGSYVAEPLSQLIGITPLIVIPAALLATTLIGVRWSHRRSGGSDRPAAPEPNRKGAFGLLFSDRYLVLIAIMMLLLNWVNTTGEYVLDLAMQDELSHQFASMVPGAELDHAREVWISGFKSRFFFWVNLTALSLQLLVVGRLMKRGGAATAIMVLPVVALASQGLILLSAVALRAVMVAKIAENSVDYSIQNTGRNALFLVTPSEVKYRVKVLVDSVFMRAGDVVAGAAVLLGAGALNLPPLAFVAVNSGVTVVWLAVALVLAREHRRRAAEQSNNPNEK